MQRRIASFSVNVRISISFLLGCKGLIRISDMLHSLSIEPTWFNTRLVAFTCLTSICLIHGTLLKLGLRLQNTLGVFKLLVLSIISMSGILCLAGVNGIQVRDEYEKPDNFAWGKLWEGSGTGANAFVNGLYNVIWCESVAFETCCMFFIVTDDFFQGLSLGTRTLIMPFQRSATPYEPSNAQRLSP